MAGCILVELYPTTRLQRQLHTFDSEDINQSVNFYSGLSDRSHFKDHKSASDYDRCRKNVFNKCFLKDWSVAAVTTCSGKEFQIRGRQPEKLSCRQLTAWQLSSFMLVDSELCVTHLQRTKNMPCNKSSIDQIQVQVFSIQIQVH